MMQDWQLPDELQQLERDLAERPRRKASNDLRPRILGDLRGRLGAERTRARWQFALAVAVVVLVWLNLSMSATQATDFGLRLNRPSESIETIAGRVHQLAPEFSEQEARRQAVLLRAGSQFVFLPHNRSQGTRHSERSDESGAKSRLRPDSSLRSD
jgi:hypothetical protein